MNRAVQAVRQMLEEDLILNISHDMERCYQWLVDHNLLWQKRDGARLCQKVGCPGWQEPMKFVRDIDRPDGGRFRCSIDPGNVMSLRDDTIFEGCRAPLPLIYRVLFYHFVENHSITRAIRETGLNKNTVAKIYAYARYAIYFIEIAERVFELICEISLIERKNEDIQRRFDEGENLGNRRRAYDSPACEMDEALLTHIGNEQIWVLGAWDRAERRSVLEVVGNDRSGETIQRFVRQYITTVPDMSNPLRRTRVYHDGWLGYAFLDRPESLYEGFRVIHEGNHFGFDIFSTNRIEGFWGDLRRETNFQRGRHFRNIREVQKEVDLGNWRIKNRRNKAQALADALYRLTFRGGGIGANIINIENFEADLADDDVNDNLDGLD